MSETANNEYMVEQFGGNRHPDNPSLQQWLNEMAKDGWKLISVSDNVGYFERVIPVQHNTHRRHR